VKSIRRQLVVNLMIGSVALYAAWATAFYFYTWHAFNQQFDTALAEKVQTFTHLSEVERRGDSRREDGGRRTRIELEFLRLPLPEFQPSSDAMFYQVWAQDGTVLARSPSLVEADLPRPMDALDEQTFYDVTLPSGQDGRALALRFLPRLDEGLVRRGVELDPSVDELTIVMARSREPLDAAQALLLRGFLLFGLLLPAGTIYVVRKAVGRGLSPLDRMANDLATIGAGSLTTRFATDAVPAEMRPVAARLNDLLGRLDTAFRRERRLTTDIAHELRTPIAELRLLAELRLRDRTEESADGNVDDIAEVHAIARQMEHLVDTLLALARCDSGTVPVRVEPHDLVSLIRAAWKGHQATALERGLKVDFRLPDRAGVETDAHLLSAALANLFANAATHTPEGGRFRCELAGDAGRFVLTLANTDDQLGRDDLDHLFEPLWRKDSARSDPGHVGLGLSLVKAYADLLGLDLRVDLPEPGWFAVTLGIPRAQGRAAAPAQRPSAA
jgi:two-component system sensor histidine kinase QseC